MLSVSYRDTDNTDHIGKTITPAADYSVWGLDLDWGLASGLALRSVQAQESDCRLDWEPASELHSASDSGLELGSERAQEWAWDSESDSVFDSVPASVAPEL